MTLILTKNYIVEQQEYILLSSHMVVNMPLQTDISMQFLYC